MNGVTKAVVLSAALVAAAGAVATPGEAKGRHHWDFDAVDTNADGFLTLEEVAATRDQKFEDMDTDKDGALSKDEIKQHRKQRRAKWERSREQRAKATFERMDTDKNGSISPEELEASMAERESFRKERRKRRADWWQDRYVKHVDANNDGKITKAELTTAYTTDIFERLDTDKDSRISKAEAEAAHKWFWGHHRHD